MLAALVVAYTSDSLVTVPPSVTPASHDGNVTDGRSNSTVAPELPVSRFSGIVNGAITSEISSSASSARRAYVR